MPVRPVGGDEVVLVAHRAGGADDRGLLADREVQEAADLGLGVHLAGALLEAADQQHGLEPLARHAGLGQRPGAGLALPLDGCDHVVGHGPAATLARSMSPARAGRC